MSCAMSEKLGVKVEATPIAITVLSPLRQSNIINKIYKRCPPEVQGVIFLADLMELLFGEFDLILGMDWLVEHRENLDCATKRVKL